MHDGDPIPDDVFEIVERATRAFVNRDMDFIRQHLDKRTSDPAQFYIVVDEYPDPIAMPSGRFTDSVYAIKNAVVSHDAWGIDVDLGTPTGARSDLTLQLRVDRTATGLRLEFQDCHVL